MQLQEVTLTQDGPGTYGVELTDGRRLEVTDAGPRATDLVLAGLATCSARTFLSVLAGMRLAVAGLRVRVEAERAEKPPTVFTRVRLAWDVRPGTAPEARVSHALDLTEKYCPVLQMLQKAVPVEVVRRIERPAGPAPAADAPGEASAGRDASGGPSPGPDASAEASAGGADGGPERIAECNC